MKRKVSLEEIYFEIPLKRYLGKNYSDFEAVYFGERIIQKILERTASGLDVKDRQFKPYSEAYKKSLNFKAFGKTDLVNLELTGSMLSSLDILEIKNGIMKIGIKESSEVPKAYNHIRGDTLPKRDFLGISKDELEIIADEISLKKEVEEIKKETKSLSEKERGILEEILSELEIEEELLWQELN